jgi:hypothetical protein
VREFLARKPLDLPFAVYRSPGPEAFNTRSIPAAFVLNQKGEVVFREIGGRNWDTDRARRFLRSLLSKKEVHGSVSGR